MSDISLKYNMLGSSSKKTVQQFIEFLLQKEKKQLKPKNYKENLMKVSVWSEEDIRVFSLKG